MIQKKEIDISKKKFARLKYKLYLCIVESSTTGRTGFRKTKITDMKKRVLSVFERLVKYALSNKFQLKAILILFSLLGLVFICTSFYNPALLFLALPCIITVIACINELNKK